MANRIYVSSFQKKQLVEKPLVSLKIGSPRSTGAETCQSKVSVNMFSPMAPCWAVFGKWCARGWSVVQLYHDEERGANAWDARYVGCRFRGTARHREVRVDSLAVSPLKKSWSHQCSRGQPGNH